MAKNPKILKACTKSDVLIKTKKVQALVQRVQGIKKKRYAVTETWSWKIKTKIEIQFQGGNKQIKGESE